MSDLSRIEKIKLFGFSGAINPVFAVKDLAEDWRQENIVFSIKNGVFEARYGQKNEKEQALSIANLYIQIWNFEHDTKLTVDFNHFWEPKNSNGTAHSISFCDGVETADRVVVTNTITHTMSFEVKARIVGKSESVSFAISQSAVEKSLKDESLKKALKYYSNEVVDSERPLYGIYKAIEELSFAVGSWNKLANLANKPVAYINDLKQTTQTMRHSRTPAKKLLTDQECRERAKFLIHAYLKSI